jgi:hypothetical protein
MPASMQLLTLRVVLLEPLMRAGPLAEVSSCPPYLPSPCPSTQVEVTVPTEYQGEAQGGGGVKGRDGVSQL